MNFFYNGISFAPNYEVSEQLEHLEINDSHVLINRENGGWAKVTEKELVCLFNPVKILPEELGEKAYKAGLAKRNNGYIFEAYKVDHSPDVIYFFEFDLANECNLNCIYCSDETIPEKIKKGSKKIGRLWIDRVYEYAEDRKLPCVTLEFTGGEPLVNVDVIYDICEYSIQVFKKMNITPKFLMSSNLTVLGDKQIKLFKDFKIDLQISLDGPEEIQNKQRPFPSGKGSYDIVIKNIEKLRKEGIECNTISSVITAESVKYLSEIAQLILNLGFKHMTLQPMVAAGRGLDVVDLLPDPEEYVFNLMKVMREVLLPEWLKNGDHIHVRHLSLGFAYLLEPWRNYMCQRCPCGCSSTIISTKANGDVYGCNSAPYTGETILGNIIESSFEECVSSENAKRFQERDIMKIKECRDCVFRSYCQAGCPKSAISLHGDIHTPGDICELNKHLFKNCLEALLDKNIPYGFIKNFANSYMR